MPVGGEAPIPQEKITQIFNTYVIGSANNIATGSSHVSQRSVSGVEAGDLESLLVYIRGLGVSNDQVSALKVVAESSSVDRKIAAEGWLGKLVMSAATGATTTSIGLAANAIARYFGLHAP
jgi:hypothetical protein